MTWLRIAIGVLIAAAVGVALVPLAVLVDLKDGGSGWGLCPQGLDACRSSYFAGFELLAGLILVLAVVLLLIHLCVKLMRRLERHKAAHAYLTRQRAAVARQQALLTEQQPRRVPTDPATAPGATPPVIVATPPDRR